MIPCSSINKPGEILTTLCLILFLFLLSLMPVQVLAIGPIGIECIQEQIMTLEENSGENIEGSLIGIEKVKR